MMDKKADFQAVTLYFIKRIYRVASRRCGLLEFTGISYFKVLVNVVSICYYNKKYRKKLEDE